MIDRIAFVLGEALAGIRRNVPHGATVVVGNEPAVMLDVYSPPRAEYVAAAAKPATR